MGGDEQSKKESECKEPPRQKGGIELLIDRVQSIRREKWEIKAAKKGPENKGPG
jgi:hypothetical protein